MNGINVQPVRIAGRNGYDLHRPTIGAPLTMSTGEGRANVTKVAAGIAMMSGGVFAMMSIPQAKKVSQYALGGLGAGLLVAGTMNIYDALA